MSDRRPLQPREERGELFISAFTAPNAPDKRYRGITLRISDAERRSVVEAEITFENFGSAIARHNEVPILFRRWLVKP